MGDTHKKKERLRIDLGISSMKVECVNREDSDWIEIATRWAEIHSQISLLEKEEDILRERLIALSNDKNVMGGGVRNHLLKLGLSLKLPVNIS